ncbi:hypothetical protein B0H14DRAFT_3612274 [Mycena olivaceomarginata]|nr:hypothetical protein B0H14DRAFT_3612274 [Mycena olivaceomarginata]
MPPRRRVDSEPKQPRGYRVGSSRYSQSVPAADSKQVSVSPASGPSSCKRCQGGRQHEEPSNRDQALPTKPARKRFYRADDADDSIPNPVTLEEKVREAGRHFVVVGLVEAPFLVDVRLIWTVELKEDFDFAVTVEFESKANKVQGQLHNFEDSMSCQCSTISNRLRRASLQVLMGADQLKHFQSSSSRFEGRRYKPATDAMAAHYSAFDARILYDDYDGTINVDKIFRHSLLLKIYVCVQQMHTCVPLHLLCRVVVLTRP